jgi:clan AA aspartic protease (TIGR02281 family)
MRIGGPRRRGTIAVDAARWPARCHAHPAVDASALCAACREPICDLCATALPRFWLVCPDCREKMLSRARAVRAAALAGAALVAALAAVLLVWQRRPRPEPPPVVVKASDAETDRLRDAVEREPCDRVRIVRLVDDLVAKGESREVLAAAGRFFSRCGDHPRLRWVTYEAHRRLGEWDAAISEATRLIDSDRYDRDYWGWRGLAYEAKGDTRHAIADYRQALTLEPRLAGLPFNLAALLERTGRPCEAIFPLEQFLHYYPELPDAAQVRQRIIALYESGSCGDYAARGTAVIAVGGSPDALVTVATVNRRHRGRFLIDTGASYVALSASFAGRLGLEAQGATVLVQTANGPVTARPVVLDAVAVQGASAARVSALVMDTLPTGVDGLLGLSFLSRFQVKLDRAERRLELTASRRKTATATRGESQ